MTTDPGGLVLPAIVRPDYFPGQRLTAADLLAGQAYQTGLRRLHNRTLHTWGIALGLAVTGAEGDKDVVVQPGYALDDLGRELVLDEPVTVTVPPAADGGNGSPARYLLILSYVDDADAAALETRAGACGGSGAVRLSDAPLLRWQPDPPAGEGAAAYRPGHDVVLAVATVRNCRLSTAISLDGRRDARPPSQPYTASGTTPPGQRWDLWQENGTVLGISTTVDTSGGHFRSTPNYLAQQFGEPLSPIFDPDALIVFVGTLSVTDASTTGFTANILMPEQTLPVPPPGQGSWKQNPRSVLTAPGGVEMFGGQAMHWGVHWVGLEG